MADYAVVNPTSAHDLSRPKGRARVLYISYDGVLESIGQSQVLPYLESLARRGVQITLLTFEKPADMASRPGSRDQIRARLASAGIEWTPLRYHKRPVLLSTVYDLVRGVFFAIRLARRHRVRLVHVRSYVPAAMALPARWFLGCSLLFDIRGLWVDERIDGGIWRRGVMFRIAKMIEPLLYRSADAVVSLTEAGKRVVERLPAVAGRALPVEVIPTCVDTDRFRPTLPDRARAEAAGLQDKVVFAYIGSVGTWYALDSMLDFFQVARREIPNAALLFVVRGTGEEVQASLRVRGLEKAGAVIPQVPHEEIPAWLSVAHVGMALIRPTASKVASFPTKIGEYLACGLPIVVTKIGDFEGWVEQEGVGLVVREFSSEEYRRAARSLLDMLRDPALRERCRRAALARLSLEGGVQRYHSIYCRLTARGAS